MKILLANILTLFSFVEHVKFYKISVNIGH